MGRRRDLDSKKRPKYTSPILLQCFHTNLLRWLPFILNVCIAAKCTWVDKAIPEKMVSGHQVAVAEQSQAPQPKQIKKKTSAFRSSENTEHKIGLKWADIGGRKKKQLLSSDRCASGSEASTKEASCSPALPVPQCGRDLMSPGGCRHLQFKVGWCLSSFLWEATWKKPRQL